MSVDVIDDLGVVLADEPAEQCVLGGMLLSPTAIAEVVDIIGGGDFYNPRHQAIWEAITGLFGAGEPVDPVTVASALSRTQMLSKIGGAPYLHTLIATVPTAANAAWYAHRVAATALRRRLAEAGIQITMLARRDGDDLAATAEQILLDAADTRHRTRGVVSVAELLNGALERIEAAGANPDGVTGLPTGISDIDQLTGGLQPGQLVVVAGRPGMGKSVFGANITTSAALRSRVPTLFISLEMTEHELTNRLLAAEAGVSLRGITRGDLNDGEWTKVAKAAGLIAEAPLWIDASARTTVLDIRAKARRLAATCGGLGLVIIDYLQLMGSVRRAETREREVAEISRSLKLLAKDLDCPVVAIAQLNRGVEQRTDKHPMLSDLRESGAVEADADLVFLLYRDDYYDKESPRAGEVDIDVAKNRGGPTDTITAAAQLHLARFADMAIG